MPDNTTIPKMPFKCIIGIAFFLALFLSHGLALADMSSMLDFLALVSPILFTAFGIWLGVINPSKLFIPSTSGSKSSSDDGGRIQLVAEEDVVGELTYRLCYFLMCCTSLFIATIVLKLLFYTFPSWQKILSFCPVAASCWIIFVCKIIAVSAILTLYGVILWISFAFFDPLLTAMNKHDNDKLDEKIQKG